MTRLLPYNDDGYDSTDILPATWLAVLGVIGFYVTKKSPRFGLRTLVLYIAFMAMLGPIGEIFVGTVYEAFFGHALWQYRILPSHTATHHQLDVDRDQ